LSFTLLTAQLRSGLTLPIVLTLTNKYGIQGVINGSITTQ